MILRQMAVYDDGAVRMDIAVHAAGIVGTSQFDFTAPLNAYLFALMAMFGISATYNLWPRTNIKRLLWRMDHCSICAFAIVACNLFWLSPVTPKFLVLLAAGFATYLAGLKFLLWNSLRFHNAIWHGCVLLAAMLHYQALICVWCV
jgi:predicted membrane channel-forming protein YqfA (hemolysin III family)